MGGYVLDLYVALLRINIDQIMNVGRKRTPTDASENNHQIRMISCMYQSFTESDLVPFAGT